MVWRQRPAFAGQLLDSLAADMLRFAAQQAAADAGGPSSATGGGGGGGLRPLLALAACSLCMLDAAAAARLPSCHQQLLKLLRLFRDAAVAAAATSEACTDAAAAATAAGPAVVAELAGHVGRLAALAPAAAAAAAAAAVAVATATGQAAAVAVDGGSGSETTPVVGVELDVVTGIADLSLESQQQQEPVAALQQQFAAVAAFAEAAGSQAAVLAQPAAVLALLAAVRCWTQMLLQQPQQQPLLDGAAAALLPQPSASGGGAVGGLLLSLRSYGSKEAVLQSAQQLQLLLRYSPAALTPFLADCEHQAAAVAMAAAAARQDMEQPAVLLSFNLQLLQAAVGLMSDAALHQTWRCLLPLARQGGLVHAAAQQHQQLWLHLLRLLQTTAARLAARSITEAVAEATVRHDETMALLAGVVDEAAGSWASSGGATGGAPAAPSTLAQNQPSLLLALRWMQQAASEYSQQQQQQQQEHYQADSTGAGAAAALRAALACANADPSAPAVRAASLVALVSLVQCSGGALLASSSDPDVAVAVLQTALLHLSDLHPAAASASQQLLLAVAAPLAIATALTAAQGCSDSATATANEKLSPAVMCGTAAAMAIKPQQLVFRPLQMQQLLEFFGSSCQQDATAAAPLQQWLPRLLLSLPASVHQSGTMPLVPQ